MDKFIYFWVGGVTLTGGDSRGLDLGSRFTFLGEQRTIDKNCVLRECMIIYAQFYLGVTESRGRYFSFFMHSAHI